MNVQRVAGIASLAVVVMAVVAGLVTIGSPAEQRLLRRDEQRVNGLTQLARRAELQWTREQRLAASAVELVDQYLTRLPTDPATREPYEYRVTGPRTFEVCGAFERPSRPELAGDFWFHEAGRHCFAFEMTELRGRP
jgi:hypothetical protein